RYCADARLGVRALCWRTYRAAMGLAVDQRHAAAGGAAMAGRPAISARTGTASATEWRQGSGCVAAGGISLLPGHRRIDDCDFRGRRLSAAAADGSERYRQCEL